MGSASAKRRLEELKQGGVGRVGEPSISSAALTAQRGRRLTAPGAKGEPQLIPGFRRFSRTSRVQMNDVSRPSLVPRTSASLISLDPEAMYVQAVLKWLQPSSGICAARSCKTNSLSGGRWSSRLALKRRAMARLEKRSTRSPSRRPGDGREHPLVCSRFGTSAGS